MQIGNGTNMLNVRAEFVGESTSGGTNTSPAAVSLEIKAFRNGIVSGSCVAANNSIIGQIIVSNQPAPRVVGCLVTASSNSPPTIAFSVNRLTTFVCTNGSELTGTYFEISPIEPQFMPEEISNLNIYVGPVSAFTITAERSASTQPRLSISATDSTVTLSWRDNTRLFRLESSSTLPDGFTTVSTEPEFSNNQNQITLPREATGARFFRLRSGPD